MSDTPRTDAAELEAYNDGFPEHAVWSYHAKMLERELQGSHAREAQLRAALEYIRDVLQTEINMGNYDDDDVRRINDESIDAGREAEKALTLPAPPVVPVEDVKPLVEALTKIVKEQFYPMSKRLTTDAGIAEPVLKSFIAKHSALLG